LSLTPPAKALERKALPGLGYAIQAGAAAIDQTGQARRAVLDYPDEPFGRRGADE